MSRLINSLSKSFDISALGICLTFLGVAGLSLAAGKYILAIGLALAALFYAGLAVRLTRPFKR